jgi:hypothetical protein
MMEVTETNNGILKINLIRDKTRYSSKKNPKKSQAISYTGKKDKIKANFRKCN